jgi:hypothetical protein
VALAFQETIKLMANQGRFVGYITDKTEIILCLFENYGFAKHLHFKYVTLM